MTYLISGAGGFIGRSLTVTLRAAGHSVESIGRTLDIRPDMRADTIVHLAGEPIAQRWNSEIKKRIHDSRVEGTRRLVANIAKLKNKPKSLICASAIGYYGNRGDELLTESSPAGSGFLADVCVEWEEQAAQARALGVRVVSVRIGVVLGAEGGALKQMLPIFRLGLGGKFGDGRQWMSWIHLEDLVRLLIFAAETETVTQPVNGTTLQPVTNVEFTRKLAGVLHRPAIFAIPAFALKTALGEMARFLMDSTRVVSAAPELGFVYAYPELSSALESVIT